jgi:hypothetical protein
MAHRLLGAQGEMFSAFLLVAALSTVAQTAPDRGLTLPLRSELAGLPAVVERPSPSLRDQASAADDEPGSARIPSERAEPAKSTSRTKQTAARPAPQRATRPPVEILAETEEPPGRSKVLPMIVLGGSVVAAIVGAVFVSKTMDAIEREPATTTVNQAGKNIRVPDEDAIREQQTEVLTNGIVATVSLSGAIAGAVSSAVLLVSD